MEKASETMQQEQKLVLEKLQPDFNLTDLNHDLTSNTLEELNKALLALLVQQEVSEKTIQKVVNKRALEVEHLLEQFDDKKKREFATLESHANQLIMAHINNLKDAVQSDLGKVSKASKAIKKYRQG